MSVIKGLFILFLVVAFICGIYICGTYKPPYLSSLTDSSVSYSNYYEGLTNSGTEGSGNNYYYYWKDPRYIGINNNDSELNNKMNNMWENGRNDSQFNNTYVDRKDDISKNGVNSNCPDLLIRKGNTLLLYNTTKPEIDGINPIPFFNLDEYINYLEIQRKNGIHCPVLYLQQEENTQGQSTYRIRQSPFLPDGLPTNVDLYRNPIPRSQLTSGDDNPPYNANQHMSFDPYGQYIGKYTDLDALHDSTFKGSSISDNPMDSNWGGVLYTKSVVDSGKYKENEVAPPTSMGPWTLPSDNIRTSANSDKLDIYA